MGRPLIQTTNLSATMIESDLFDLQCEVDTAGYELVDQVNAAPLSRGGAVRASDLLANRPAKIIRRGGKLQRRSIPRGLHRVFATIDKSPEGALEFVNQWGFLRPVPRVDEATIEHEYVDNLLAASGHIRQLLLLVDFHSSAEKKAANKQKRAGIVLPDDENPKDWRRLSVAMFNELAAPSVSVRLRETPPNGFSLGFRPTDLFGAMLLQVAEEITTGLRFKFCPECGTPFEPRRANQERCSKRCNQRFYQKKKDGKAHQ